MPRRGPLQLIMTAVLMAVGATGCSGFRAPAITTVDATFKEATDEALLFDVAIELSNSNADPIELLSFDYTVSVDGVEAFKGRRAAGATLGAGRTNRVALPAVVVFDAMGWDPQSLPPVAQWSIGGELNYTAPGEIAEILLDTGVRRPRVRFGGRGNLTIASGS